MVKCLYIVERKLENKEYKIVGFQRRFKIRRFGWVINGFINGRQLSLGIVGLGFFWGTGIGRFCYMDRSFLVN